MNFEKARNTMVENQLRPNKITNQEILKVRINNLITKLWYLAKKNSNYQGRWNWSGGRRFNASCVKGM